MADFNKFRQQGKYFDLRLLIKDQSIDVHKAIICEKSGLIEMLVRREDLSWPPVHTIELTLPENISFELLQKCLDFLYSQKIPEDVDSIDILNGLLYLSVEFDLILQFVRKYLPDESLEQKHLDLLLKLIDIYGTNKSTLPLISFYSKELADNVSIEDNILLFGSEDIKSTEHQWIHLPSDQYSILRPDRNIKFKAFEINWIVSRFTQDYGYGDDDDIIKIYTDKGESSEESLNIQATFVIYSEKYLPKVEVCQKNNLIPSNYTISYLKHNYKSNKLGFALPTKYKERIRISLLLEKL